MTWFTDYVDGQHKSSVYCISVENAREIIDSDAMTNAMSKEKAPIYILPGSLDELLFNNIQFDLDEYISVQSKKNIAGGFGRSKNLFAHWRINAGNEGRHLDPEKAHKYFQDVLLWINFEYCVNPLSVSVEIIDDVPTMSVITANLTEKNKRWYWSATKTFTSWNANKSISFEDVLEDMPSKIWRHIGREYGLPKIEPILGPYINREFREYKLKFLNEQKDKLLQLYTLELKVAREKEKEMTKSFLEKSNV